MQTLLTYLNNVDGDKKAGKASPMPRGGSKQVNDMQSFLVKKESSIFTKQPLTQFTDKA
jgi:hypothetical protein